MKYTWRKGAEKERPEFNRNVLQIEKVQQGCTKRLCDFKALHFCFSDIM